MMLDIWQQLQSFMGRGGPVLWVILALLVLMWILMIERLLYLNLGFAPLQRELLGRWQARRERHSWHARAIRGRWLAEVELALNRHLIFIRTLVVLCPMLGLLGTVTGMIGVFDALAAANRFNPESMAGGISRATIPTRAGMVGALSGGSCAHYLYCGSCWEHGRATVLPTNDEGERRAPLCHYGKDKLASENYLMDEWRENGFPATVIMPGQISGPGWDIIGPWGTINLKPFQKVADGGVVTANLNVTLAGSPAAKCAS